MKVKKFTDTLNEEQEAGNNIDRPFLDRFLNKIGIEVTPESDIIPTKKFGRFLCNMAVRDGLFDKINNNLFRLHGN